jgi:hypothetical protein
MLPTTTLNVCVLLIVPADVMTQRAAPGQALHQGMICFYLRFQDPTNFIYFTFGSKYAICLACANLRSCRHVSSA